MTGRVTNDDRRELGFTSKKSLEVIAARKGSSNCV
jgi:hypothetical protein